MVPGFVLPDLFDEVLSFDVNQHQVQDQRVEVSVFQLPHRDRAIGGGLDLEARFLELVQEKEPAGSFVFDYQDAFLSIRRGRICRFFSDIFHIWLRSARIKGLWGQSTRLPYKDFRPDLLVA